MKNIAIARQVRMKQISHRPIAAVGVLTLLEKTAVIGIEIGIDTRIINKKLGIISRIRDPRACKPHKIAVPTATVRM